MKAGSSLWGPHSRLGLVVLAIVFVLDQASKTWLIQGYDLEQKQPLVLTPFMDFVLLWNRGVSYSLFESNMQWALVLFSVCISIVLWRWLARTPRKLSAVGLGLVIGGALGNSVDRLIYGAVADFVHLFWGNFHWYVFNLADCAIVAGVVLLFYDSWHESAEKRRLGNA